MPFRDVGEEISRLTHRGPSRGPNKGKRMTRHQAIAASLSMARRGDFGSKSVRSGRKGRS